jgi:NAD(P)-dependent dehydrogenase (short-subunit alcohol dehydrogenase family)
MHAIIAGVGPGMGLAIAKRFAREGYNLSLIARHADKLDGYAKEIGGRCQSIPADLSDVDQAAKAMATAIERFGPPDVLVYNAGVWNQRPAMEMAPKDFHADVGLCVSGAFACAHAIYPHMKKNGQGTILFTGGGLALQPQYGVGVASLTAGKSALRGLAFVLASELEPDNIHVSTITIAGMVAPGTAFDPDAIADHYWRIHSQSKADWTSEYVYSGQI